MCRYIIVGEVLLFLFLPRFFTIRRFLCFTAVCVWTYPNQSTNHWAPCLAIGVAVVVVNVAGVSVVLGLQLLQLLPFHTFMCHPRWICCCWICMRYPSQRTKRLWRKNTCSKCRCPSRSFCDGSSAQKNGWRELHTWWVCPICCIPSCWFFNGVPLIRPVALRLIT